MKIVYVLLLLMLIPVSRICFAEISYSYDKFDDHVQIKSEIGRATGDFTKVYAYKDFFKNGDYGGSLSLMMIERDWYFFSPDRPIDIKFDDDDTIYQLKQGTSSSKYLRLYSMLTVTTTSLEDTMLDKFLCANKITIRAYFSNKPPVTWAMSTRIIKEWKRVFITQKDGVVPSEYIVIDPKTEEKIRLKEGVDY